jgi:hypothetical protein
VLTFSDGRFESDPARTSTLSSAEPAAFGFLGTRSATVKLEMGTYLQSAAGSPATVTAGDITVDSAVLGVANADLRLAAVGAKAASVPLAGAMPANLAGRLYLGGNATVVSLSTSGLPAGDVHVSAGDVILGDGLGLQSTLLGSFNSAASTGNAGSVELDASGALTLDRTASLFSRTNGAGDSGSIRVRAGSAAVDSRDTFSGIYTHASTTSTGNAGAVNVLAMGAVALNRGGQIFSNAQGEGDTGSVSVSGGSVTMGGEGADTWIYSLNDGLGNSGPVTVTATGAVTMHPGASVWSQSIGFGDSGAIHVKGNTISLEGNAIQRTSVSSTSRLGSIGDTGSIFLDAAGALTVLGSVGIATIATDAGDAGNIRLSGASITLDGQGNAQSITTGAFTGSTGEAGNIDIVSRGALVLHDGAFVSTSTNGSGNAGAVRVLADSLTIEGGSRLTEIASEAHRDSTGHAGNISIKVNGLLSLLDEGTISSSTAGSGNAGTVVVEAGSILMDSRGKELFTGITTSTLEGSTGNAGKVFVQAAGELKLLDYGEIASATEGSGSAGAISVEAATIVLDNAQIVASAGEKSSGQVGDMLVRASESITLRNGALLNLQNGAIVAQPNLIVPGVMLVSAPVAQLDRSLFSSVATGNVAAGSIAIQTSERLTLESNSYILTGARVNNGGHIAINGGKLVILHDSSVITSVLEGLGNGGDIDMRAGILLLQSGMIKANTGALGASGGDIRIATDALLTSGSSLLLGGSTVYGNAAGIFGYNVIQAAAPTGVSGTVALSTPALDISGALAGLAVSHIDTGGLGRNPCQASGGSTLVRTGRGGFAPSARGWLAPGPVTTTMPLALRLRQADCSKG